MKKLALAILTLLICAFSPLAPVARAHDVKTDGTIGVTMHALPFDSFYGRPDPPTIFEVIIQDTAGKFTSAQCVCVYELTQAGKSQIKDSLTPTSHEDEYKQSAVFPYPAEYVLKVSGTPQTAGAFQPFKVEFDIQAQQDGSTTPSQADGSNPEDPRKIPPALFAGFVMLVIFLTSLSLVIIKYYGRKKN